MLARIFGKSDIYHFKIEIFGDVKTFDFLKVTHHECGEVLTQVINITRDHAKLVGDCKIIGYRDSGVLKNIRTPFTQDATIEIADDTFIEKTVGLNSGDEAFFGLLEHHPDLKIQLDLKKMITKHVAVLAKSGAGKSYTVGVLLEEVIKKNIPIVILDPHSEYGSIKYPNSDKKDLKRLEKFNLKPQGFLNQVKEYSPDTEINSHCEPLRLDINTLRPQDFMESLPQKLSPSQQNILFNILSSVNNRIDVDELIFHVSNEETNAKWSLISQLEQFKKLKIYSSNPTPIDEVVRHKQSSIISLKGVEPGVQEIFVAGLMKNLFDARKREEIPPFLLVLEEAHNFIPERSFGETRASKIIRTLASEGRKFGIGLCVISQRPAKVDKNVISQCTTQVILKITNPNDLKSVISSSEGVTSESENEIQKLNIGTCLLTGVIDIPLKVNIRPRISKHGGETVDITLPYEVEEGKDNTPSYDGHSEETEEELFSREPSPAPREDPNEKPVDAPGDHSEFVQHVAPEVEPEDAKVLLDTKQLEIQLVPGSFVRFKTTEGKDVQLLIERTEGTIIKRLVPFEGYTLPATIRELSGTEKKLIPLILGLKEEFNPAELLLKTDIMYNEILRVCDTLAQKGLLKKVDKSFQVDGLKFAKHLDDANFYGNQKFEEISYDTALDAKISEEDIRSMLELFGTVESIKELSILRYKGK